MNSTFGHRLSQAWFAIQDGLFPEMEQQLGETLTPKLQQLIRTLEIARVEEHLPDLQRLIGRPQRDRAALARAFVAKAVLNLTTTEALIDRLHHDDSLKRVCGFNLFSETKWVSFCFAFVLILQSGCPFVFPKWVSFCFSFVFFVF